LSLTERTNAWGDKTYRWWNVLVNERIVEEVEDMLEAIET
jgi:hypothetical protein